MSKIYIADTVAVASGGNIRMENIALSVDQLNTVYGGNAPLDFAALFMPELRG